MGAYWIQLPIQIARLVTRDNRNLLSYFSYRIYGVKGNTILVCVVTMNSETLILIVYSFRIRFCQFEEV